MEIIFVNNGNLDVWCTMRTSPGSAHCKNIVRQALLFHLIYGLIQLRQRISIALNWSG